MKVNFNNNIAINTNYRMNVVNFEKNFYNETKNIVKSNSEELVIKKLQKISKKTINFILKILDTL